MIVAHLFKVKFANCFKNRVLKQRSEPDKMELRACLPYVKVFEILDWLKQLQQYFCIYKTNPKINLRAHFRLLEYIAFIHYNPT
jgi:hypothetical protein